MEFIIKKIGDKEIKVRLSKAGLSPAAKDDKLRVKVEFFLPAINKAGPLAPALRFETRLGLINESLHSRWGFPVEDANYRKDSCYYHAEAENWEEALFEAREYAMGLLAPLIDIIEKREKILADAEYKITKPSPEREVLNAIEKVLEKYKERIKNRDKGNED